MDEWTRRLIALALVAVANVAPWACGRLFGTRFNLPLDVGHTLAPGRKFPILDQLPEALLPLIALARPLGLLIPECLGIAAVFSLLDLATLRLRHTPPR
jgi:hypothetical protein